MEQIITLLKGYNAKELFKRCPGMDGVVELYRLIRIGELPPWLVVKRIVNDETGDIFYRCTEAGPASSYRIFNDGYDRPEYEPAHVDHLAFDEKDVERLIRNHPELGWDSLPSSADETDSERALKKDLKAALKRNEELEKQVTELMEGQTITMHCDGPCEAWATSFDYLLPIFRDILKTPKGTLTRESYFNEIHKEAPGQLLKNAFHIMWRHLPSQYKSGQGRPKK
ncbi:hypothetical protein [Pseudodesulfovibrio sp. zrk46]|uniref:hypothetical protein n=1 Tax=Pseudodesulfovibrio sp. zrk46 TaxID=2725288 RepID=UPI001448CCAA|nr:hypothetical protein [Pseudodesulfovibrio sp. zrk46]QJB55932.1 hypothetical protein HFN16_05690 [Pseudodesulfovibrio sp. zrk46]